MTPPDDLDRFTETELAQLHMDTYRRALGHFKQAELHLGVMTGLPHLSAEYDAARAMMRAARSAGTEAHELLRAIGRQLDAIRGARKAATDA